MKGGKAGLALGALLLVVPLLVIVMVMGSSTPPCDQQGAGGPGMGALAAGGIPVEFVPLLQKAGTLCPAFPAPVLAAQIKQESGFHKGAVSSTGALGYSQFMPGTWATYGKDTTGKGFADPNDFSDAVDAQARFDCTLANQITDAQAQGKIHSTASMTEMALGGYNAGYGAVLAAGGVPGNAQTAAYVPLIMTMARTQFSEAGTTTAATPDAAATPGGAGVSASGGCGGNPVQVRVLALSYPDSTGAPQSADVYLPPGGGAGTTPLRPMIVMVHGGGWYFGDRHELDGPARDAAMHGYAVINIEYAMSAPRWPTEPNDVRAAISWARSQAPQWGGDPAKMATWGDSAGANLALDVAATGDHGGLQAAVGWSGPYDLPALPVHLTPAATDYQKAASIADPAIYLGCLALICPSTYTAVSPALSATPGMPPVYVANSANELVPMAQQDEMVATLTRLGTPHTAVVVPGTGHAVAYAAAQTAPTLAWLDHTLGFTPPPPVGVGGTGGPAQQGVVAAAMSQRGATYVWGGGGYNGPTGGGFDCSGLTAYAFHQVGTDLPRTAQAQYAATASKVLPGGFTPASYQAGDLLFWGTPGNIHHVALAIGNGQLIQASTFGEPLATTAIYNSDFFAATRPLG
jgi:cell wall-associated NlpC family hydrolase